MAYLVLLLWATFATGSLGSPAVYPLGLVGVVATGTLDCLLLLLPSTALAEWLQRRRGYSPLAGIPLVIGALALLCLALACLSFPAFGWVFSVGRAALAFAVLFLLHLAPLGLYWWTAQSGPLLFALLTKLRLGLTARATS